ncbi:hypothetical protein G5I_11481 [Acromyrmex echinatior]|uniref:Uncharacterized protein n=1 Tax=Acromyrmex echinatior TaxID=103372 RepID=F4WZM4_ACREC|nr:hypothetical protein G5I_11481 [Acromyrmex echinatior]
MRLGVLPLGRCCVKPIRRNPAQKPRLQSVTDGSLLMPVTPWQEYTEVAITILVAAACLSLARSQKSETSAKALEIPPPPVKLDKNLRQALLKALTELEAESAEHRKDEDEKTLIMTIEEPFNEVVKKNLNKNIGVIPKGSFSFDNFPGDEETLNEEKLQNSSFLESKRYVSSSSSGMIEKASHEDARSYHVQNVGPSDKSTTPRTESIEDLLEIKKISASLPTVSKIDSITLKPITQLSESLAQSASSGITSASALIAPKPTASSPTAPLSNVTSSFSANKEKSKAEEVKILQAPLVAAFTVQQDELGVPKSVKPHVFEQSNVLSLQPTVHLQPSLSLEVPSVAAPPLFRTNYQDQLHFQQFRQQPQPQVQLQQPQPQLQHQQRLQQNFVSFSTTGDFQPPVAPATRFNRQEAFNAVGNFGFNLDNKQPPPSRNAVNFNVIPRNPNTFVYNPYLQFKQTPRAQTPAKQIQRLLYQSGVAGDLGNVQGQGSEDLNIVSKVLALNVGALPTHNKNYQYITNNRGKLGSA